MKKTIYTFLFLLPVCYCFSQTQLPDSTKTMDSVVLKAYEQKTVATVCCAVPLREPVFSPKTSLVNGLNAVAGVRMEERSPGSYRLSIRGSSLRSPFGVRNIKVYWNGIPVTDPGGNTYFNQFAWNNFSNIEIAKGPASSMYGSGTGGLVLLDRSGERWKDGITAEYITGSYNLHNFFLTARAGSRSGASGINNGAEHTLTYAHNQTDGYRIHTNMRRDNITWTGKLKWDKHTLTTSVLFTDMHYQTPGALNLAEFNADPKAARPAAGGFPGAVAAGAAIYQKNVLAGITHEMILAPRLKNTTTLYANFAQVKNPAIRNYERRNEPSFGGRSYFWHKLRIGSIPFNIIAGAEFQQGYFNIQVSKNRNGNPDTLQTNDDINSNALVSFTQVEMHNSRNTWGLVSGISNNGNRLSITRLNKYPVVKQQRNYRNEITPRIYFWKRFNTQEISLSWTATVSKGFSPPTTAEVLPSTGIISTSLEAEKGWNYESTIYTGLFKNKLEIYLTGFYFKLYDALVQRRDLSGADFFVNAGDIRQNGIEFRADYHTDIIYGAVIKQFRLRTDITLNHFRYGNFIKGSDDFSGKKVPSVPSSVLSLLADVDFKNGIYCSASYYGASSIYLNDANTFKAYPYHLLGIQLGWKKKEKGNIRLNIYAGIDNLLNETYSLGNDINAAANRFYNAAPLRNYYAGVALQWIKQVKK
ncbi:MAG: TonB-dependent receptor plug domain-containing protein [Chitinophagaceae bacterium]|nr:TonB-dependent receptor plug domain-containing protein [Chitinophagaceae bacterium]